MCADLDGSGGDAGGWVQPALLVAPRDALATGVAHTSQPTSNRYRGVRPKKKGKNKKGQLSWLLFGGQNLFYFFAALAVLHLGGLKNRMNGTRMIF